MALKSGFERTIVANLQSRGIPFSYEELTLPYIIESEYQPDFLLKNSGIIVEAKGLLDKDSKRKMLIIKKTYPELDIRFLFMEAHKKIPGTKQTHAQWATRNGYQWAEGTIPEEWL